MMFIHWWQMRSQNISNKQLQLWIYFASGASTCCFSQWLTCSLSQTILTIITIWAVLYIILITKPRPRLEVLMLTLPIFWAENCTLCNYSNDEYVICITKNSSKVYTHCNGLSQVRRLWLWLWELQHSVINSKHRSATTPVKVINLF